nr:MAG TPA: hypothetical protein [Caudoviricetes sp.]
MNTSSGCVPPRRGGMVRGSTNKKKMKPSSGL